MQWRIHRKQTSLRVDEHVLEGQEAAQQRCQPHLFSTAHCFCHGETAVHITTWLMLYSIA